MASLFNSALYSSFIKMAGKTKNLPEPVSTLECLFVESLSGMAPLLCLTKVFLHTMSILVGNCFFFSYVHLGFIYVLYCPFAK